MDSKEKSLDKFEDSLNTRETNLDSRETEITNRENEVQKAEEQNQEDAKTNEANLKKINYKIESFASLEEKYKKYSMTVNFAEQIKVDVESIGNQLQMELADDMELIL